MSNYKFEQFIERDFPIYSTMREGKGNLVVPHYHSEVELLKIISGEAEFSIDTNKFMCRAGDIIFIPPFCVHSLYSNDEKTKTVGVVFNLSIINSELFNKPLVETLTNNYISSNIFEANSKLNFELSGSMENIYNYYKEIPLKRALIYSEIIKICYYINEKYSNKLNNKSDFSKISPAIDYIKNNFSYEISLKKLSEIINVSENHLIRLFKKATNKTPIKYINDIRIEEALKLLINSDMQVTEIALKVGFSSVNYMSKVFTDTLKTTPSQFRKTKHI